jgi:protoporphyrin/coproporphyrin ferrochelatase
VYFCALFLDNVSLLIDLGSIMKHGLLLINLGTPYAPSVRAVRAYLREFLTDKRVITLPRLLRYLLVYGFILPFRPKKTAKAYRAIWTNNGSPLLDLSLQLASQVHLQLHEQYQVVLGMRYGAPSIASSLEQLKACDHITILPLYPQYASATTGSSLEETLKYLASMHNIPSITIIHNFYQHPAYINAMAQLLLQYVSEEHHLVLSYHGIPVRNLKQGGCINPCQKDCPEMDSAPPYCYRAQCFATSRLLASALHLDATQWTIAFQSRLGRTPWIEPYFDTTLQRLKAQGIKKIAIACPSFVTDCLETLEEIGIRAKAQWLALGGEELLLIPCLNADTQWIDALIDIAKINNCAISIK